MTTVWSNGGGTQSAAIAALIVSGELEKPDLALIADTTREKTATWEYHHAVLAPALARVGVTLQIVNAADYRTRDLYANGGQVLIPAFTTLTPDGTVSKLPTYCSSEWKRRVVTRYLRSQGVKRAEMWLGISTDELHRMRDSDDTWVTHRYPLIDRALSRDDCYRLVRAMGWPEPPKSSCWMCPHQGDRQWADLKVNHRADFDAAVALEREVQERDPHVWLHRSGVPLDLIDFDPGQDGLFDACGGSSCWT
jgi:rhodanese-related sulfurtransferase